VVEGAVCDLSVEFTILQKHPGQQPVNNNADCRCILSLTCTVVKMLILSKVLFSVMRL